jgi:hypothetical protein
LTRGICQVWGDVVECDVFERLEYHGYGEIITVD